MPKVSVIIPTYNNSQYIVEALNSVLLQTYRDFEVIIVDDGSTDNTYKNITGIITAHPNLLKYIYQENRGLPSARNIGIKNSCGEYIALLDSDDAWLTNKLEQTINNLEENSEISMVYSDMYLVNRQGDILHKWLQTKNNFCEGYIYNQLIKENFIIPSSVVIRRRLLDEVGYFDENITYAEDYDLWLRIAEKNKIGLVNHPLVKWRQHDKNMSKNFEKCSKYLIKVFNKQIQKNISEKSNSLLRERLRILFFDVGLYSLEALKLKEARDNFSSSLKIKFSFKILIYFLSSFIPCFIIKQIKIIKRFSTNWLYGNAKS